MSRSSVLFCLFNVCIIRLLRLPVCLSHLYSPSLHNEIKAISRQYEIRREEEAEKHYSLPGKWNVTHIKLTFIFGFLSVALLGRFYVLVSRTPWDCLIPFCLTVTSHTYPFLPSLFLAPTHPPHLICSSQPLCPYNFRSNGTSTQNDPRIYKYIYITRLHFKPLFLPLFLFVCNFGVLFSVLFLFNVLRIFFLTRKSCCKLAFEAYSMLLNIRLECVYLLIDNGKIQLLPDVFMLLDVFMSNIVVCLFWAVFSPDHISNTHLYAFRFPWGSRNILKKTKMDRLKTISPKRDYQTLTPIQLGVINIRRVCPLSNFEWDNFGS